MNSTSSLPVKYSFKHAQEWSHEASFVMVLVMAFGLPWSHAFFRIGLYGLFLFYALSGKWKEKWRSATSMLEFWLGLGLFAAALISLANSDIPTNLARHDVQRLLKLIAMGVLVYLLNSNHKRTQVLIAFSGGVCVLMLPTVLDGTKLALLFNLPIERFRDNSYHGEMVEYWSQNLVYWRNQIVHGFLASILCFICLVGAVHFRRHRPWLLLLAVICTIDIAFFIRGRMALLSLVACFFIFALMQIKSMRGKLIAALLICGFCLIGYQSSSSLQKRVNSITSETQDYYQNGNTSSGAAHRFRYWAISFDLFKKSPILGAGPGAFRYQLEQSNDPYAPENHSHAHNEYITIASQYGLVGLSLFLSLIGVAIYRSRFIENFFIRDVSLAAILIFALNCLTDSMLYNVNEGWTFVLFLSIIGSVVPLKHKNINA
jgi:ABC-type multidrug transport system fused ATPase/permease subunit